MYTRIHRNQSFSDLNVFFFCAKYPYLCVQGASCTSHSGLSVTLYGFHRFSLWEMEGGYFNDAHYPGLGLWCSVYLLAGAPYPLLCLWSCRVLCWLTLIYWLPHYRLAPVHSRAASDQSLAWRAAASALLLDGWLSVWLGEREREREGKSEAGRESFCFLLFSF